MNYSENDLRQLKSFQSAMKIYSSRIQLTKNGREWKALCPLHSEKSPSFTLTEKDGRLLWHCFGCGKGGDVFNFLEDCDQIPFEQAVEKAISLNGWGLGKAKIDSVFQESLKSVKKPIILNLAALLPAEQLLKTSPIAKEWLSGRGLSLEIASKLRWGFVQSAKAVKPDHPWVNDGWMLFPTIKGDSITCLKYRSVRGKRTESGESGIIRKSGMATSLYNLEAIDSFEDIFVVEGEMDVAALTQAGYRAVAYPSANYTPTPEERRLLLQANTIYLAGDMDAAGQAAMTKLWSELRDRTYRISWPEGCKDANDAYLAYSEKFVHLMDDLKQAAQAVPMPHIYDMKQTLLRADATKPLDNPARLRFPWKSIDEWTAVLPGDVMSMFATESKSGKTTWLMNILLHSAIQYGKVVVNYSAELPPEQYARRMAACLNRSDRNNLKKEDFESAARKMGEAKFFNGYKPGAGWRETADLLVWAIRILGADIIAIDNLHFLTRGEKDQWKAESEAMRAFKDIATEYGRVVIVVGAVRKSQSGVRGREAVAQDAKGSESFSADASQVYILHRKRLPITDEKNALVFDPITKVTLDYCREGEARSTRLMFDGPTATFYEISAQDAREGEEYER